MELSRSTLDHMSNEFAASVVVSTRRVGLKMIKNSVSGKDVATWLIARQYIPRTMRGDDRREAIESIGQAFIDRGTLVPVASKAQWSTFVPNDNLLYTVHGASRVASSRGLGSRSGARRSLELFGGRPATPSTNDSSSSGSTRSGVRRSLELVRGKRQAPIPEPASPVTPTSMSQHSLEDGNESSDDVAPSAHRAPPKSASFTHSTPTEKVSVPKSPTFETAFTPQRQSSGHRPPAAGRPPSNRPPPGRPPTSPQRDKPPQPNKVKVTPTRSPETFTKQALRDSARFDEIDEEEDDFAVEETEVSNVTQEDTGSMSREASLTLRKAVLKTSTAPKAIGKAMDKMKTARERKAELKDNTQMNRSERGVFEILVALEAGEPCGLDEGQNLAKVGKTINTAPLVNSQMFDKANLKKLFQATGYRLRFNERVHLRRLDEEGNLIEDTRVPIDYSIKTKYQEPTVEIMDIPGFSHSNS